MKHIGLICALSAASLACAITDGSEDSAVDVGGGSSGTSHTTLGEGREPLNDANESQNEGANGESSDSADESEGDGADSDD